MALIRSQPSLPRVLPASQRRKEVECASLSRRKGAPARCHPSVGRTAVTGHVTAPPISVMKSRRLMGRPFRPTTYPITPPGLRTLVTRDRKRADKRRCQRQPQFTISWGLFRLVRRGIVLRCAHVRPNCHCVGPGNHSGHCRRAAFIGWCHPSTNCPTVRLISRPKFAMRFITACERPEVDSPHSCR
jgi:hypothetical protein